MERVDFSGSRGDKEGWGRYGDKKRNAKRQMLVGVFLKRMEMSVPPLRRARNIS